MQGFQDDCLKICITSTRIKPTQPTIQRCLPRPCIISVATRPVTRRQSPLQMFSLPLDKYVVESWKLLDSWSYAITSVETFHVEFIEERQKVIFGCNYFSSCFLLCPNSYQRRRVLSIILLSLITFDFALTSLGCVIQIDRFLV